MRRSALLALVCVSAWAAGGAVAQTRPASLPPVVVAVVDETGGVNVLHRDFRTSDGRDPRYPSTMPRPTMVRLPSDSDFSAARSMLESGPLGHMVPGVLYAVAGTRLLLVNAGTDQYDGVQSDALHATGVADSVTGTQHGTDPGALVVVVLAKDPGSVYPWLARNPWADLASTSDYNVRTTSSPTQCGGAAEVRSYTAAGHLLFSSSGNTTDDGEALVAPNGLPETYLVGGVDSSGNTWRPGHPEESDPSWAAGNVVRPYETGELYSYQAAAPDSFTGLTHFGGTSGATPRTSGWAARLVAHARQVVGGPGRGALASGPRHTAVGPLSDGRLTNAELVALLHAVAVPHSGVPDGPGYAVEGYGALNAAAIAHAEAVLDGRAPMPSRPQDDQADAVAHQVRATLFSRCS